MTGLHYVTHLHTKMHTMPLDCMKSAKFALHLHSRLQVAKLQDSCVSGIFIYIYIIIYIICSYFLQLAKAFKMDRRTTWYSMVPGAISRGSTVFCQSYMSSPNKCCLHRGFTWVYKKQYKSSIHSLQVTSLSSSSSKHQELHSKQAKPVHILDLQELHNKNKLGRGGLRTTPTPLSTSPRAACALANLSVYSF